MGVLFLSVYGMAVDAIIHCFLLDEKLHGAAKHTPEPLADFINRVDDEAKRKSAKS